jgi:hypothetical protein
MRFSSFLKMSSSLFEDTKFYGKAQVGKSASAEKMTKLKKPGQNHLGQDHSKAVNCFALNGFAV